MRLVTAAYPMPHENCQPDDFHASCAWLFALFYCATMRRLEGRREAIPRKFAVAKRAAKV